MFKGIMLIFKNMSVTRRGWACKYALRLRESKPISITLFSVSVQFNVGIRIFQIHNGQDLPTSGVFFQACLVFLRRSKNSVPLSRFDGGIQGIMYNVDT
jgi:hypothetical protein